MYGKETWVNAKAMRSRGMSYSEIAKALGINKRTAIKLCKQEEVPAPKPRERTSILDPYTEIIDAWLEKRPKMKATQIFAQLGPLGYAGSYPTVKRYVAAKKKALARQATVRFETLPGYQAQVDFGKVRVEFLSGEMRRITFFLLQLGFSRYRVAYVCPDETRDTLIACLSQAFLELGGLPQELLLDNMKPVVVRPRTADEPAVLAEDWMRFCAYYGIVTNPCWPFRAQDPWEGGEAHGGGEAVPLLPDLPGAGAPGGGIPGGDHAPGRQHPLHHKAGAPPAPGAGAQLPGRAASSSLLLHGDP